MISSGESLIGIGIIKITTVLSATILVPLLARLPAQRIFLCKGICVWLLKAAIEMRLSSSKKKIHSLLFVVGFAINVARQRVREELLTRQ